MSDLFIELTANLSAKSGEVVKLTGGNVKPEAVTEILEAWLNEQVGAGPDHSKPNERDEYHIRIDIDLSNDSFRTKHNCGNNALATGFIIEALQQKSL